MCNQSNYWEKKTVSMRCFFEGTFIFFLICRLTVFVSGGSDGEQHEKEFTCPEESG